MDVDVSVGVASVDSGTLDGVVLPHRDRKSRVELIVDGVVDRSGVVSRSDEYSVMRNHNVSLLSMGDDTRLSNPLVLVPPPSVDVCSAWSGTDVVTIDHMYMERDN